MLEQNERDVMARIDPDDVVLDIGGWGRPFNRADWVIDAEPWATRGYYGPSRPAQGGPVERFDASTWIQRDVCAREPFPFEDDAIDFCICSHTLEDIRDPLWVCSEMARVAKAGYIEVPSRALESARGLEPGIVGASHHRWLIDVDGSHVTFMMKYHAIHHDRRRSLPREYLFSMRPEQEVTWLHWTGSFTFEERNVHGLAEIHRELMEFVEGTRPYGPVVSKGERVAAEARDLATRVRGRVGRARSRAS